MEDPSLSDDLTSFVVDNGGYDGYDGIVQHFILDRSETAMFMQDQTSSFKLRVPNLTSNVALIFGASNVI